MPVCALKILGMINRTQILSNIMLSLAARNSQWIYIRVWVEMLKRQNTILVLYTYARFGGFMVFCFVCLVVALVVCSMLLVVTCTLVGVSCMSMCAMCSLVM